MATMKVATKRSIKPNGKSPLVVSVSRGQVMKLIERDAKKLGVSAKAALRRVRIGRLGDSYLWADISMLDVLSR